MDASFDESVGKYRQFLEKNGYPGEIVWVTPRDILVCDKPLLYVRTPVSEENERFVKRLYDFGISEEKGVLFETLCESKHLTFAHAWVPRDEREAEERLMPKGLKLSAQAGISRRPAMPVENRLHWTYLRLRYRKQQELKYQLFN